MHSYVPQGTLFKNKDTQIVFITDGAVGCCDLNFGGTSREEQKKKIGISHEPRI
jgi:hypothetical protein